MLAVGKIHSFGLPFAQDRFCDIPAHREIALPQQHIIDSHASRPRWPFSLELIPPALPLPGVERAYAALLCGRLRPLQLRYCLDSSPRAILSRRPIPRFFCEKRRPQAMIAGAIFEGFGTNLQIILDFRDKIRFYILALINIEC